MHVTSVLLGVANMNCRKESSLNASKVHMYRWLFVFVIFIFYVQVLRSSPPQPEGLHALLSIQGRL